MKKDKIFNPFNFGKLAFKNRLAMAPMTRSRAIGNIPNELMATYYNQRSNAGLIITEGVSPSPNGLGYARIPGIFNEEQVEGWKKITDTVHKQGSKIFVQLMHTGRISHANNMSGDSVIVAPSAIKAAGAMWTDKEGMQSFPVPLELTAEGVQSTIKEFVTAAKFAIEAGFDGVELHSANGYLLEQFLSPHSNKRSDNYGGSVENRIRFVTEVAQKVAEAIGPDNLGIRISPFGVFNDMPEYDEIYETYDLLTQKLNDIGLAYLHVIDNPSLDAINKKGSLKSRIRENFKNILILANGYDLEKAVNAIENNQADMIAFGRAFINNPDLVDRLRNDLPLSKELDASTLYSPGEKGYVDYASFKVDEWLKAS